MFSCFQEFAKGQLHFKNLQKIVMFSHMSFFDQLEIGEFKKTLVSGFLNREMGHKAKGGGGGSGETGRKKGELAL